MSLEPRISSLEAGICFSFCCEDTSTLSRASAPPFLVYCCDLFRFGLGPAREYRECKDENGVEHLKLLGKLLARDGATCSMVGIGMGEAFQLHNEDLRDGRL